MVLVEEKGPCIGNLSLLTAGFAFPSYLLQTLSKQSTEPRGIDRPQAENHISVELHQFTAD